MSAGPGTRAVPAHAIEVVAHDALGPRRADELLALCSAAYEEDFAPHFALLGEAMHVLLSIDGRLVAHAAWVARTLRVGDRREPLACAYVEAVATWPALQRRGFGTAVLRAVPPLLGDFDIAALSPSEPAFYARSGWEPWSGPLFCLHDGRRVATPGEDVMVYRLSRTPVDLALDGALEADWRPGDIW
jgi:GNAT superfamily N-acetyltransferase